MTPITIDLPDEKATAGLGARIARILAAGDIICLYGDLGAGKTTLTRGLITEICGARDVPSPTYTLVERYEAGALSIWHFDLYRLEQARDVWELGLEEALDDGVLIIEWPEKIEAVIPAGALRIHLETVGDHRRMTISPDNCWRERLSSAGIA